MFSKFSELSSKFPGLAIVLIYCFIAQTSNALYTSSDDVIELTDSNFDSKVTSSNGVWIVEFYSPNCGHCVQFAPAYKKAASVLKGVINVGAVDVTRHSSLGSRFSIRGYPTVKIFAHDKKSPQEYQGQRTAESLIQEGVNAAQKMIMKRAGGSGSSGSSSGESEVVEITDGNFDKKVLQSDKMWFIGQKMKPDFEAAARKMQGKVMFGSVDATVHQALAGKFNVRGYPTLYFFGADKKNPSPYESGRTLADMVSYLEDKFLADLPPPKAVELTKPDDMDICKQKQLCIIAALPDLLDCQSKCRKDYIKAIEKAGEKHKVNDWRYFWTSAGQQADLEKAFNLGGFGYPTLIAVNSKKQKFATMRGSFSADGIHEFLRDVSLGGRSISLQDAPEMPKIVKVEPWDGKDGQMPDVEEIDLDDLKDEL
ncbi:hypothetical protein Ciccas_008706 [Cichlidogyrus casuarinus]|uniref:protein disulfide-isomerase n=1 Tax=Cichlidogyrus casuarinus TaxID=1844966 RepID=A0ABD2PZ48_9PLAT